LKGKEKLQKVDEKAKPTKRKRGTSPDLALLLPYGI